jgi:polyhydroxyalkanoate synthesis regulator phasin
MPKNIYGVNLNQKVTPAMVRDAIVKCFKKAHCLDTEIEDDFSEEYCKELVKENFKIAGGDFEHPTKDSLQKVIDGLADFSKHFRKPETIQKHHQQIQQLINKLP